MTESTRALSDAGVSIWLDDLSRERLASGSLRRLVAERDVVGVTTNPTIFAAALRDGGAYAEQMRELAAEGAEVDEAIFRVTTDDVRAACELLLEVYERSRGFDGRVS
ncbi:MAG: transaldolase family protein, partial [Pseudoclavibacter sp.]|nr:transaldolase family protein [Pseudoclavibacter sp.]